MTHNPHHNAQHSQNRANHNFLKINIFNKEIKTEVDKNNSGSFIRYSFWKSLQKENPSSETPTQNKMGKNPKINLKVNQNNQSKIITFRIVKKSKFPISINESEFLQERKGKFSWHGTPDPRFRAKYCRLNRQLNL